MLELAAWRRRGQRKKLIKGREESLWALDFNPLVEKKEVLGVGFFCFLNNKCLGWMEHPSTKYGWSGPTEARIYFSLVGF